ncbi:uncharacterized protein GGS22DRAFT_193040 [Annulohypoxylon maeteangense]|uniref:uncharacterized protein n=1 Tax=Annulohypoxylon maeteangense TaxID=1927788 RepID=UPI002008BB0B|nr:uncharacterized protein GGS22DRAFT_193040 [Annulohypoxylon maeteangense]KAI0880664.1 hypothetical protein GGS22DRAFT_193040 [Annulohypoxylon maeteangense]
MKTSGDQSGYPEADSSQPLINLWNKTIPELEAIAQPYGIFVQKVGNSPKKVELIALIFIRQMQITDATRDHILPSIMTACKGNKESTASLARRLRLNPPDVQYRWVTMQQILARYRRKELRAADRAGRYRQSLPDVDVDDDLGGAPRGRTLPLKHRSLFETPTKLSGDDSQKSKHRGNSPPNVEAGLALLPSLESPGRRNTSPLRSRIGFPLFGLGEDYGASLSEPRSLSRNSERAELQSTRSGDRGGRAMAAENPESPLHEITPHPIRDIAGKQRGAGMGNPERLLPSSAYDVLSANSISLVSGDKAGARSPPIQSSPHHSRAPENGDDLYPRRNAFGTRDILEAMAGIKDELDDWEEDTAVDRKFSEPDLHDRIRELYDGLMDCFDDRSEIKLEAIFDAAAEIGKELDAWEGDMGVDRQILESDRRDRIRELCDGLIDCCDRVV